MVSKQVLVVEPDAFVAATIGLMLETFNFTVTVAHRGSTAREILKSQAPKFCLVVLAAVLFDDEGSSIAESVRERGLPLVMFSGSEKAMSMAAASGLQLLRKPFRREALRDEIETALSSGIAGWRNVTGTASDHRKTRIASGSSAPASFAPSRAQWRLQA